MVHSDYRKRLVIRSNSPCNADILNLTLRFFLHPSYRVVQRYQGGPIPLTPARAYCVPL